MRLLSILQCISLFSVGTELAEASFLPRPLARFGKSRPIRVDPLQLAHVKRRLSDELYARATTPDAPKGGSCSTNVCNPPERRDIKAPKENVWLGLTEPEGASVAEWLLKHKTLNLTKSSEASQWDNTVLLVELLLPNKTDTLDYIDGRTAAPPTRYARVVVDIRATENPYIQDLQVGPLPISSKTTVEPLKLFSTKPGPAPKTKNPHADEMTRFLFLSSAMSRISDITESMWGVTIKGASNDTAAMVGIEPLQEEKGRMISWDHMWRLPTEGDFDVQTVLPTGLYIKSDVTGRDPSKWKILAVLYDDILYSSLTAFRKAYESPDFNRNGHNGRTNNTWAGTDPNLSEEPMRYDTLPPPVQVAPAGPRFDIDVQQKYVEWMGFSFYIGFSRDTGIRLFNIRYKGKSLIYEFGMMEAMAHYAGNDPVINGGSFLDGYYGFGPWTFQLLPGFDCPTYATYLNTTVYVQETHRTHPDSICIFEQDAGFPLSRHVAINYATATKNIFLTVRSIATIGNYDYLFDYSFHQDGTIKVDVRASGYIMGAYAPHNEEYGYKLHDDVSGSMHDHVLNFKLDFDLFGPSNSLTKTSFIPTVEKYIWSPTPRSTMKIARTPITHESHLNWSPNSVSSYTITNPSILNKHGEHPSYRLHPSTPPASRLIIADSPSLLKAAQWSTHDLHVTLRKDTEPSSSHAYNLLEPSNPLVQFNAFFNNEPIVDDDLVLWFNLGMHHLPNSNDVPNTLFSLAHAGMVLEPVNMFEEGSPSRQVRQKVRIDFEGGLVGKVELFAKEGTCMAELGGTRERMGSYNGDVVVKKVPYDPRNPEVRWYI